MDVLANAGRFGRVRCAARAIIPNHECRLPDSSAGVRLIGGLRGPTEALLLPDTAVGPTSRAR